MKLLYSSKSDIGLVREVNQDRFGIVQCDWGYLFVVADGLGHKDGGQFASQTTVDLIKEKFSEKDPGAIPPFLQQSLSEINKIIFNQKISEYGNAMMGSTCVLLVVQDTNAYVAHVGDSRVYYFHNGELIQLTKDHSLVQKMVDDGIISKQQAETHPNKNIVTRALGTELKVQPDIRQVSIELSVGDKFLLCSDGLWSMVKSKELYTILNQNGVFLAAKELITLANKNGGYDNITALAIHIKD